MSRLAAPSAIPTPRSALKGALIEELDGCGELGPDELRAQRRAKFLAIGEPQPRGEPSPVIPRSKLPRFISQRREGMVVFMRKQVFSCSPRRLGAALAAQRLRTLNPQDVAEAQRDNAEIVRELGGAETGPRAAYVEAVGRRVAPRPGSPSRGRHFISPR